MQLRKLRVLLIPVLAAAVALAGSSPATAGGTGNGLAAGVVNGTVNTGPGGVSTTDPLAQNENNFTFDSTTLAGGITVTNGTSAATYVGEIEVAAGGKATDSTALGTGLVTSLSGSGTSVTGSITVSLGSPTTACDNTFVRVGTEVVVILKVTATVTTTVDGVTVTVTGLICVSVVATFASTTTSGNITQATFVGGFIGVPVPPV